jgi:uncharacterized protein
VDVCRIDERSGYCLGCYRSLDEIARWSAMCTDEQVAVLEAVRRRRAEEAAPGPNGE